MISIEETTSYVIDMRNRLHEIPELSMQEYKTTELICTQLIEMGAEVTRWKDYTGAVGLITGKYDGPTIAIRADIDALPIQEESGNPHPSKHNGIMHACGHDAHTAIALGVCKYYASRKDKLYGNVKFIFQPGEEQVPGGALGMIERGVMENPQVEAIFGLHNYRDYPAGTIAVSPGETLAAMLDFKGAINVAGGWGSQPASGGDGVLAAAQFITQCEMEMTRRMEFSVPSILSFSTINGGTEIGPLAERVTFSGMARSFSQDSIKRIEELIERTGNSVAACYGGTFEVEFMPGYPTVYNDPEITGLLSEAAGEAIGYQNILPQRMTHAGDDMAYFLQKAPGCYFLLGSTPKGREPICAHTSKFDLDDSIYVTAVKVFTAAVDLTLKKLKKIKGRR